ncbi:MAG: hypothetical protein CMH83_11665 [Nocardioides sp.]|nr:hypothetical protein [Nocardioides sp.]
MRTTTLRGRAALAVTALSLTVLLGACGTDDTTAVADTSDTSEASADSAAEATADQASSLSVEDPWVKTAESGMTAAFGTLVNTGDTDVTVVSATTEASAMTELHETVDADGSMSMQQVEGGFVVPAGGELVLEPGGNHLMMMDVVEPVEAGADVAFTLTLDDGSTLDFTASGRDFSGADEEYADGSDSDMGGMDMDDDMDMGAGEDSTEAP